MKCPFTKFCQNSNGCSSDDFLAEVNENRVPALYFPVGQCVSCRKIKAGIQFGPLNFLCLECLFNKDFFTRDRWLQGCGVKDLPAFTDQAKKFFLGQ